MSNLDASLDSAPTSKPALMGSWNVLFAEATSQVPFPSADQIAGLTTWNDALSLPEQVKAAGLLQAPIRAGTAWVLSSKNGSGSEEELMRVLRFAWKETSITRIRFMMGHAPGGLPSAREEEAVLRKPAV